MAFQLGILTRIGALNNKYQLEHKVIPDMLYVGDREYKLLQEALKMDGPVVKYNGYQVHRVQTLHHLCVCKGGIE